MKTDALDFTEQRPPNEDSRSHPYSITVKRNCQDIFFSLPKRAAKDTPYLHHFTLLSHVRRGPHPMPIPLRNRVVLVTGASSGIGEATARLCAEEGARLALAARRVERLTSLAEELTARGAEVLVIPADLAQPAEATAMVRRCEEHFGRVDVLVNNAGVMLLAPVLTSNPEDWRRMFELNLLGLMTASQAVLPGMIERREGHIVNISSTAGRIANPNGGGYSASKFGVGAFSESLRREVYSHNIRVTIVEPGLVATELRDHIPDPKVQAMLNAWADSIRQLQPEDVAAAICYAISQPPHVNVNEILMRPTDQER